MMLATRRFLLRDFTDGDRAAFRAYQADRRYVALRGTDRPAAGEAHRLLESFARWAAETPRASFQLAIVRRADALLISCAGLRRVRAEDATAELGIELAPDCWGRYRYAIEIAGALLEFGFDTLGLCAIRGVTADANHRVARLASWFGARTIAVRPAPHRAAADGRPEVVWEMARSSFEARRHRFAGVAAARHHR